MKKILRHWKRIIVGLLLVPLGLIVIVLIWAFASYPSTYVVRVLRYGDSDVFDYQKFPARDLKKSPDAFHFQPAVDEDRIHRLFEQHARIDNLDAFLAETGTQAFLVIVDDKLLYEKYFNDCSRDTIVTSFSTAKSFVSVLVGIAIAEGHINSVDDSITTYLPELANRDPHFDQVTIRHLLCMSSGIRYEEFPFFHGDDAKIYYYPDLRALTLAETQIATEPNQRFLYNNYHPPLLGMILERATGTSVTDYLQEKIWTPIGTEFDGSWSLDSEESGFEKMESGLNARAIDFAKFGRLLLNRGNWNGTQIVPASWIDESTSPDNNPSEIIYPDWFQRRWGSLYYNLMWWGIQQDDGTYEFSAMGNHGQYIFVSPEKRLIIIRNGVRHGVGDLTWLNIFHSFAASL